MITVHTVSEVDTFVATEQNLGKKIGFVPTMGALHDGHLSLVQTCKKHGLSCVMSIFVNPTQFGPNEDLSKYPKTLETDKNLAFGGGVNLLFVPSAETIYPGNNHTWIDPPAHLNQVLCGPFRPGHFRGVCTVVNRLLDIVQPNALFLGQKDAQQLRILQMVMKPLHPKTEIISVPTIREKNGLAMSSRNQFLSEEEKNRASILYKALATAQKAFELGEKSSESLLKISHKILESEPSFKIQYLEIVRWKDFKKSETISEKSMMAVAGYFKTTRLIDNVILE
jgi:pantoate--beta-alanine ligase